VAAAFVEHGSLLLLLLLLVLQQLGAAPLAASWRVRWPPELLLLLLLMLELAGELLAA
jgi:hypothetical protein